MQCHSGTLPKERDGISAIAFSFPGMWSGVRGQADARLSRNASARTSCAATREWRDAIRSTQLTVGELSLSNATCLWAIDPQTPSIHSHNKSRPAISRSELVNVPRGFVNEMTLEVMSAGHWRRNTVGGHPIPSPSMTPPTPKLDASTIPMTSGHAATRSRHSVGRDVDRRRRKRISVIASRRALFRWR